MNVQILAEAEEKSGFKISLPTWWSREEIRRTKGRGKPGTTQIGALPVDTQEAELVKDVLSLLLGMFFKFTRILQNFAAFFLSNLF